MDRGYFDFLPVAGFRGLGFGGLGRGEPVFSGGRNVLSVKRSILAFLPALSIFAILRLLTIALVIRLTNWAVQELDQRPRYL